MCDDAYVSTVYYDFEVGHLVYFYGEWLDKTGGSIKCTIKWNMETLLVQACLWRFKLKGYTFKDMF